MLQYPHDPGGTYRCGECQWVGIPDNTPEQLGNISLRDYFASMAMGGALATDDEVADKLAYAGWCYDMADAMMEARKID